MSVSISVAGITISVNLFSSTHVCVLKYVTQSQLLLSFELVIKDLLFLLYNFAYLEVYSKYYRLWTMVDG